MANITLKKAADFGELVKVETTALSTSGDTIEFTGEDEKTVLVVENGGSASGTLTILKGDGIQGVKDLVISVPVGTHIFTVESGAYKQTQGADKGKLKVKASANTIKATAIELR